MGTKQEGVSATKPTAPALQENKYRT